MPSQSKIVSWRTDGAGSRLVKFVREHSRAVATALPGMFLSEIQVAPHDRVAISERQLKAGCHVLRALAALDDVARPVVLSIVRDGATIRGYAAFVHVRHTTAAELLRRGLSALADHYQLAVPRGRVVSTG